MSHNQWTAEDEVDKFTRDHGYWAEHPDHLVADWKAEIANEDTREGYWEWTQARIENAESDK